MPNKVDIFNSIPLMAYLLLATGTVWPVYAFGMLVPLYTAIVVAYFLPFFSRPEFVQSLLYTGFILLPMMVIYLISSVRGTYPLLIFERLEGAFLMTFLVAPLVTIYVIARGEIAFQKGFLKASLFILFLTVLYKISAGFFDREQRFFLNGPIVFGWIMGFAAVSGFYLTIMRQINLYVGVLVVLLFLLAVVWSASKGPIIAVALTFAFIILINMTQLKTYFVFGLCLVGLLMVSPYIPESAVQRLAALSRILDSSLTQSDYGSIGIRQSLWRESFNMFLQHPLFGVGVGNWKDAIYWSDISYPHNITMEVAAETGLFGLIPFLGGLVFLLLKSSNWMRATLIYFFFCTSFSGDFSYLRFIVALPIAFVAARRFAPSSVYAVR